MSLAKQPDQVVERCAARPRRSMTYGCISPHGVFDTSNTAATGISDSGSWQ